MPAAPEAPPTAVQVFGDRLPLAVSYAEMLATDALAHGLLGPREVPRMWERHVLNCAVLTELLPADARIVDVGSGAGLPGLVVAIRRPDVQVELVESLQRRVNFLVAAVDRLGLGGRVRVLHGRAEDKSVVTAVGRASWVTARAVAPLDRLTRWCLPLLAPGGRLLAIKGATAREELARHAPTISRLGGRHATVVTCGESIGLAVQVISVERVAVSSGKKGA